MRRLVWRGRRRARGRRSSHWSDEAERGAWRGAAGGSAWGMQVAGWVERVQWSTIFLQRVPSTVSVLSLHRGLSLARCALNNLTARSNDLVDCSQGSDGVTVPAACSSLLVCLTPLLTSLAVSLSRVWNCGPPHDSAVSDPARQAQHSTVLGVLRQTTGHCVQALRPSPAWCLALYGAHHVRRALLVHAAVRLVRRALEGGRSPGQGCSRAHTVLRAVREGRTGRKSDTHADTGARSARASLLL
jgi:hypothetical protein